MTHCSAFFRLGFWTRFTLLVLVSSAQLWATSPTQQFRPSNATADVRTAYSEALRLAQSGKHSEITPLHLLHAMTKLPVYDLLFAKYEVDKGALVVELEERLAALTVHPTSGQSLPLPPSTELMTLLNKAMANASEASRVAVGIDELFQSFLEIRGSAADALAGAGARTVVFPPGVVTTVPNPKGDKPKPKGGHQNKFWRNLVAEERENIRQGRPSPLITGRVKEMRQMMEILRQRQVNNAMVLGENGVGKTRLLEGLAQRIARSEPGVPENIRRTVPAFLKNREICLLDTGALIAGTKYRGQFEERVKSLLAAVKGSNREVLLAADEAHLLVGAGRTEGPSSDALNIMKPDLERGTLGGVVFLTTEEEYEKYFTDPALISRFQEVHVSEPDVDETTSILRDLRVTLENEYELTITDEALVATAKLSDRYIRDAKNFNPRKAIKLLNKSCARVDLNRSGPDDMVEQLMQDRAKLEESYRQTSQRTDSNSRYIRDALKPRIAELERQATTLRKNWAEAVSLRTQIDTFDAQQKLLYERLKDERTLAAEGSELPSQKEFDSVGEELQKAEDRLEALIRENPSLSEKVDETQIALTVEEVARVPVAVLTGSEAERVGNIDKVLLGRVIGQDAAVKKLIQLRKAQAGGTLNPKRPKGAYIFAGPPGVGKTLLAEEYAEFEYGSANAMVVIEGSKYSDKHAASGLIGAPPGFVGFDQGGELTNAIRKNPHAIVYVDEWDQIHSAGRAYFYQILEMGGMKDARGRWVDCRNITLICTTNVGQDITTEGKSEAEINNELAQKLRAFMGAPLLDRFSDALLFRKISKDDMRKIVDLELAPVIDQFRGLGISLHVSEDAKDRLGEWADLKDAGARALRKVIEEVIRMPVGEHNYSGQLRDSNLFLSSVDPGGTFQWHQSSATEECISAMASAAPRHPAPFSVPSVPARRAPSPPSKPPQEVPSDFDWQSVLEAREPT